MENITASYITGSTENGLVFISPVMFFPDEGCVNLKGKRINGTDISVTVSG